MSDIGTIISSEILGTPISGSSLSDNYIITFYNSRIRIFSYEGLFLIREKDFYSKITDIKTISRLDNGIITVILIILFKDKIVQTDIYFNCLSLTMLKSEFQQLHIYVPPSEQQQLVGGSCIFCLVSNFTEIVLLKISVSLNEILSVGDAKKEDSIKEESEYSFNTFSIIEESFICSNLMVELLDTEIPTIIAVTKNEDLQVVIKKYTLDKKLSLLDEYLLIDYPVTIKSIGPYIFIIYKHFIELRYKRDKYTITVKQIVTNINRESNDEVYFDTEIPESETVNTTVGYGSDKVEKYQENRKNITFSQSKVFEFKGNYYLLNGVDGMLFEFFIRAEANRIFEFKMEYIKTLYSYITSVERSPCNQFVLIGSVMNNSILLNSQLGIQDEIVNDHKIIKVESEDKLTNFYSQTINDNIVYKMTNTLLLSEEDNNKEGIFSIDDKTFSFDKMKIIEINNENILILYNEKLKIFKYFNLITNKEILNNEVNNEILNNEVNNYIGGKYINLFINENILSLIIYNNFLLEENENISETNKFYFNIRNLDLLIRGEINLLSEIADDVSHFKVREFKYFLFECSHMDNSGEEVQSNTHKYPSAIYLFFNLFSNLYIYRIILNRSSLLSQPLLMERLFINVPIYFPVSDHHNDAIFPLSSSMCFINSEIPYLLTINNNNIPSIVKVYFNYYSGNLVNAVLSDSNDLFLLFFDSRTHKYRIFKHKINFLFYGNLIIMEEVTEIDDSIVRKPNFLLSSLTIDKPSILPNLSSEIILSNIYTGKSSSKSEYSPSTSYKLSLGYFDDYFKYIPFIPKVHKTTDMGTTITENLYELPENTNIGMIGLTKRFFISLSPYNNSMGDEVITILDRNEYITAFSSSVLYDKYVFISTAILESEDQSTKGRIIIYSIPDKMIVGSECTKISITDVNIIRKPTNASFDSPEFSDIIIVASTPNLLTFYEITLNFSFVMTGRSELKVMTTSIGVFRNFVIAADLFWGIHLFFLRPENPLRLSFLSKGDLCKNCIKVLITPIPTIGDAYTLIITGITSTGSIINYTYNPQHKDSLYGNRLIKISEIATEITECVPVVNGIDSNRNICKGNNTSIIILEKEITSINYLYDIETQIPEIGPIYNSIAGRIKNSCGLVLKDYLIGVNCIKRRETIPAIFKRILMEFFYFDTKTQNLILDELSLGREEIKQIYLKVFA